MSAKRLAFLLLSVFVASGIAQVNQLSLTVGRTFIGTQSLQNDPTSLYPRVHFGDETSFAFNYARLLKSRGMFGLSAELPVAVAPRIDLNTYLNQIPKDIGVLFVTPSVRVNFFHEQSITPWASVGAGWTRWRQSKDLNYFDNSSAPTSVNTYAIQFGAGLDVWPWHRWGIRTEFRDFYSGTPDLNANPSLPAITGRSRQHNFYLGIGAIHRF